jgi:hypothetical protein
MPAQISTSRPLRLPIEKRSLHRRHTAIGRPVKTEGVMAQRALKNPCFQPKTERPWPEPERSLAQNFRHKKAGSTTRLMTFPIASSVMKSDISVGYRHRAALSKNLIRSRYPCCSNRSRSSTGSRPKHGQRDLPANAFKVEKGLKCRFDRLATARHYVESDLCDLDPILVFKLVKVRFATVTRHGTKQLREMRRRLQRKFVQPDSFGLTPS